LSKPPEETGIPTISEINRDGRRKQDKTNLANKVEAEEAKTANLRSETVTVEDIESAARESELSNDRVLRLGDERLEARMKTLELTVLETDAHYTYTMNNDKDNNADADEDDQSDDDIEDEEDDSHFLSI
jgi:hypothetical protein